MNRRRLLSAWLVKLLGVSLLMLMGNQCRADGLANYGEKIKFKKGMVVKFADFELVYLGQRTVTSTQFKPGMVFEDFSASNGTEKVKVCWSAGAGDLGPVEFQIGAGRYRLELRYADGIGRLKDSQLVVKKR